MPKPVRLLLVAHNCSPSGGSEARCSFEAATHLGRQGVDVTVVHNGLDQTSPIDPSSVPSPENVKFVSVNIKQRPTDSRLPVMPYVMFRYQQWQRRALAKAVELHKSQPFDVVHHLSWSSLVQGSVFHKLGIPFVMGPVGGGVKTPPAYMSEFVHARGEKLRNLVVDLMRFNPTTRILTSKAAFIVASNPETADILKKMGVADCRTRFDDAVGDNELRDSPTVQSTSGPLRVMWMSRILERKALRMALAAIEEANEHTHVVFTLIGAGPDRDRNQAKIEELVTKGMMIDLGWCDQERIDRAFMENDVILYNSLRDNGSAPLHAASRWGMPAVVLDHQGPGFITDDSWAIKVPLTNPEQSVTDLAQAMMTLAQDPQRRVEKGQASLAMSHGNRWSDWADYLDGVYQDLR
jgi:glycosyltransferase involved in cell wall biosynthesis